MYQFTKMPRGRDMQALAGMLMMYPFFVGVGSGVVSLFQAVFYKFVTSSYAKLEDDTFELEKRKDDLATAVRVTCIVGHSAKIQHLVDKSYLNGRRGVIMSTPDATGKVAVLIDSQYELKVEEYQLCLDVTDEELETKREFMVLKTGESRTPHSLTHTQP
jgi:hypothetical protein